LEKKATTLFGGTQLSRETDTDAAASSERTTFVAARKSP
jgi:hypothetical protein